MTTSAADLFLDQVQQVIDAVKTAVPDGQKRVRCVVIVSDGQAGYSTIVSNQTRRAEFAILTASWWK